MGRRARDPVTTKITKNGNEAAGVAQTITVHSYLITSVFVSWRKKTACSQRALDFALRLWRHPGHYIVTFCHHGIILLLIMSYEL